MGAKERREIFRVCDEDRCIAPARHGGLCIKHHRALLKAKKRRAAHSAERGGE